MPQAQRPADPSLGCYLAVGNMHQLAEIGKKTPLVSSRATTMEMFADGSKPTEEERRAISLWAKERADCTALGRSYRAQYATPAISSAFETGQLELIQAISRLYAGEWTYGQFNRERQQIASRNDAALQAAVQSAKQQAYSAQQAQSMENMQMLQTMQLLQAMQPQAPAPILRPPVNCVSRRVGSQVYTDCQ